MIALLAGLTVLSALNMFAYIISCLSIYRGKKKRRIGYKGSNPNPRSQTQKLQTSKESKQASKQQKKDSAQVSE